jgi:hypothetical protein
MGIQINGQTDTITAVDGGLIVSGADFTGVSAGTTAAPSISPTGDSNTGIFFPSADTIAFAEGGVEALRITSAAQLQAIGAADVRLTLGSGGTAGTNDSVHIRADGANLKFMNASGGATIFEQNGTERLRIDSSGRRTLPYQPMAYVTYSGTAITRSNIIPFTAVTNQGGHWNNSTYRFTCPVAGVYHASLNMTGNTTQSVQVQSSIRQNLSSIAMSYYPGGPVSISILCAANDYIDFFYNHDNAGYPGATPAQASVYLLG